MGNTISPCYQPRSSCSVVKLIFWEGTTRILTGKRIAGEIMFAFPDRMVCHAGSFIIGQPIPILSTDDELITGQTYFVLPLDAFPPCNLLSATAFKPSRDNNNFPFEYMKGSDGRLLMRVRPEFIVKLLTTRGEEQRQEINHNINGGFLCSTPELKKHYHQLVGSSRAVVWSPKLETISEYNKSRCSPCRFIEWKK